MATLWFGISFGGASTSAGFETQRRLAGTTQQTPVFRLIDGKRVESTSGAETRTVGVMIENLPSTRPQAGLAGASVVYETLVEGGATRFLALYPIRDTTFSRIGPVRSVRPYYLDWLTEYEGVLVHAGGSPEALSEIYKTSIPNLNAIAGQAKYFWRDRTLPAPHNLFTSSEKLQNALDDTKRKTKTFIPWVFKEDRQLEKRPADGAYVTVKFSGYAFETEYRYRRETNSYARFNAGQPHEDALAGEQVHAKNVIVQIIPKILAIGEKGRLTLDVYGEGTALIFVDGGVNIGTWKKADRAPRTEFFFADGTPAQLNRGNTWVEVVPEDRTVEYGDGTVAPS